MKKFYFFDLDGTLIDTERLRPFMNTAEGRKYVIDNVHALSTRLVHPDLVTIVDTLHRERRIGIASNSPGEYCRSLLRKHGFPLDIPVYPALKKPLKDGLEMVMLTKGLRRENTVMIGDSAADIIAAHECGIASGAVQWGRARKQYLQKAEPSVLCEEPSEIFDLIDGFDSDDYCYSPRKEPDRFAFAQGTTKNPVVEQFFLYEYFPVNHPNFYNSKSSDILKLKRAKNFSYDELKNGALDLFFHNGMLKGRARYWDVLEEFTKNLSDGIEALGLSGGSFIIASPNAFPYFCYQTDVNRLLAKRLNKKNFNIDDGSERYVHRVIPKHEAHNNGSRDVNEHLRTIGIPKGLRFSDDIKNVVLIDDVSTTGSQLNSIGVIIREVMGYGGNIISLSVGRTKS